MSYGWCKTEQGFLNWLNQHTRKLWCVHPVKQTMIQQRRTKALKTGSKLMVYKIQCDHCNEWFQQNMIEVNHKKTVGKLTAANVGEWFERMMMVQPTDLEVLCKPCHAVVTHSERTGLTKKDASLDKQAIAFAKLPIEKQKSILAELKIDGGTTAISRRQAYFKHLKDSV